MSQQAPTLINLPPPPSDPVTPSDAPGTPNSTTTSMSELSTVAIKDGHRGHNPHHHHPLDAERADRISRLAGLERVATARQANMNAAGFASQAPAYFDQNAQPQIYREKSTVGSASATGSVDEQTTWASKSYTSDPDKMSEDQEMETGSIGGFSDGSLVRFGEGAQTPAQQGGIGSPVVDKASAVPAHLRERAPPSPMTGISMGSAASTQTTASTEAQMRDARGLDGMSYDAGFVDTSHQTPPPTSGSFSGRSGLTGTENAERIMRDRIRRNEDIGQGHAMLGNENSGDAGRFSYEGGKQ